MPNQTSPVEVGGKPAVLSQEQFDWGPHQWITWHPADGLTAQVSLVAPESLSVDGSAPPNAAGMVSLADLTAFANAVGPRRDDRVRRTAAASCRRTRPRRGRYDRA
ncbi:hypothetical protein O7635_27220 [Asanoa sp. WMMD1127]|uniref:hypothetical protein n=1 Tax=Asanoa sp. WMMD1127 TaxID=3016107 RepID=UPI0024168F81|nr:hypothetical protein [Asanoa sp. WMMD1127]MDG4825556.1 hypothetical protein [Asanoa sp. WMMD1127]